MIAACPKLDGYRALAVKRVTPLAVRWPICLEGTVVDGELVGLDDKGRPNFNLHESRTGGFAFGFQKERKRTFA
jgi:hypothetical protein